MNIQVQKATEKNIAPFGQLIKTDIQGVPAFFADHFAYWKQQGSIKSEEEIEIGVLEVKTCEVSFNQMEMHNRTFECLVPLNGDFIIPLALSSSGKPTAGEVSAFHISHGDVLLLNTGCWHWMPSALSPNLKILVIYKNNTSATDLVIESLDDDCLLVSSGL